MSNIVDKILCIARELPEPPIARIIIVRYGIPIDYALKWEKHDGIMWINERMWSQIPEVEVSRDRATSLWGVPVEYYNPAQHGDLWFEFLHDSSKALMMTLVQLNGEQHD